MKNKDPQYIQRYADVEGNLHRGCVRHGNHEVYVYRDAVHVTEDGRVICRARSGRLHCGGIDILAIRGPSDELFVCAWVYNFSAKKIVDFMGAISVPDLYVKNITEEHEAILRELINECKEEINEG